MSAPAVIARKRDVLTAIAIGAGVLTIYRRSTAIVLLVLGALGVAVLTLNVDAALNGFLLPAFVLGWLLAGAGLSGWQSFATWMPARIVVAATGSSIAASYRSRVTHASWRFM